MTPNIYKGVFTAVFIILLSLLFMYPVALNSSRIIFGYSGDNFGNIWHFWWQNYAQKNHLNVNSIPLFNAPKGIEETVSFIEYLWVVPGNYLSSLTNAVFTFNVLIFLGFVLSFLFMYLLASYITKEKVPSFIVALLYAFSPFHYWQATSHLSLSFVFWLPLFVFSLLYFDANKNLKSAIFLSFTFLLTINTTFYYGFFSSLIGILFFCYKIAFNIKVYFRKEVLGLFLISGAIVFFGTVPMFKGLMSSRSNNTSVKVAFSRQLDELLGLSARPWDYLIFPPNHPVFGGYNKQVYDFIQSKGSDFKVRSAYLPERVIFLGIVNVLLAIYAVVALVRKNEQIKIILFLLVSSFIISMPPYFSIKGATFYTPSYFLYQIFPLVRVYARFGIFVLLFTLLLTAYSIKYILGRAGGNNVKMLLTVIITAVTVFEFLPDFHSYTDIRNLPQVYEWLASQEGDFIVAEYPKSFDLQSGLIFQQFHEKRLFNMPSSDPRFKLWNDIQYLQDSKSYQVLRAEGVKYVIYHLQDLTYNPYDDWRFFRFAKEPTTEEEAQFSQAGFKLVERFPEALVYEVN